MVIELDEETGLYYYEARYLDPKYSMWISTDPALGEYIPKTPIDEEAKKYNQNLPGMGGVFNHINSNLYHYAGNNPVHYSDPIGNFILPLLSVQKQNLGSNEYAQIGNYLTYDNKDRANVLGAFGCLFVATVNIGNSINKYNDSSYTDKMASEYSSSDLYFDFGKEGPFRFYNVACDFGSSNSHLEKLLSDMTGKNCSIKSVWGKDIDSTLNVTRSYASKGAYLIGKVKTPNNSFHYINITGFDENGNMQWEDPYDYQGATPQYSQSDILELKDIYVEE